MCNCRICLTIAISHEYVTLTVPIEEAVVIPAESVSLPTASIHDLPINNPIPSSEGRLSPPLYSTHTNL